MSNEEFLKKIKEIGKIQEIEDAFKNNPVEEEEHKGKLDAHIKRS